MNFQIDGNDLLAVVQKQRNDALDEVANNAAAVQALLKQIAGLQGEIAELKAPKVHADPNT